MRPVPVSRRRPEPAAPAMLPLLAPLAVLAGCTEGVASSAPWIFISVAFIGSAAAFFGWGAARARARLEARLREARALEERRTRLSRSWVWQTDGQHALIAWHEPGLSVGSAPAQAASSRSARELLPAKGAATARLTAALRSQQAFSGLELQSGDRSWVFDAVPRLDDASRFAGFDGTARPAERATNAAGDGVEAILGLLTGPALWVERPGLVWQVRAMNAAAQALWPGQQPGAPTVELAGLPTALSEELEHLEPGAQLAHEPWQVLGIHAGGATTSAVIMRRDRSGREIDAFSSTLSHDLRAPIRVVEGFTRILKEDYGHALDRVGNDHLERVLSAAARMNLMIDALLTLARLSAQPLARQPVDLSQLAGFVVDELRRSSPDRSVEVEIEPGLAATGDPTLLRLVLENLLGNAWKYSARSPRARIALRRTAHEGAGAFEVADNGVGFDMRSADRLFGLFQRLHSVNDFPGHGVGLASVRRIVQRHGGEIWARAEPGRGARFTFTLG